MQAFRKEANSLGLLSTKVIAADANPSLSAACHLADESAKLPRADDASFLPELFNLCSSKNIELVIPTIDTELLVLARAREEFEKNGVALLVSDETLVTRCRDKRKTAELFAEIGVSIPKIYSPDDHPFPVFVKPIDGSSSKGLYIARTPEDLPQKVYSDENSIFCELIPSENYFEVTVDSYHDKQGLLKEFVPRLRIETRSGEVSKSKTIAGPFLTDLESALSRLKGARGCITSQFFVNRTSNKLIGIEINPRFGGGYPLSYFAGANFPRSILCEYFLEQQPAQCFEWKRDLLMLRYDKEVIVE